MNCAYKFRIYPNKKQEKQIAQSFGCARFIFNRILELSKKYYDINTYKLHADDDVITFYDFKYNIVNINNLN